MKSERQRPAPPRGVRSSLPILLAALYVPLLVMVLSSFLVTEASGESAFSLRWYIEVFHDPILWISLSRSFIVAIITAMLSTVIGLLGAFALDKWNFAGRSALQVFSVLSLMLPELVLALSLLTWFSLLGVSLSLWTVVAAHVTLTLPFVILVIGARLKGLDPAFDDAARDLGAKEWQVLVRITLPLLNPAILTAFILAFLLSFDDFLVTFYTNGSGSDTLPVRLYSLMKSGLSPKIQALSSIMLVVSVGLITILVRLRSRET